MEKSVKRTPREYVWLYVVGIIVGAANVIPESDVVEKDDFEQLDLFTDYEQRDKDRKAEEEKLAKEKSLPLATIGIKEKYGKNAILKGTNFLEGSTARDRNRQVGGHKA